MKYFLAFLLSLIAAEIVTVNGQTYTLERVARWVWQSSEELPDGQQVNAEIKGHVMPPEGQFRGNQVKAQKLEFRILDIRANGDAK